MKLFIAIMIETICGFSFAPSRFSSLSFWPQTPRLPITIPAPGW